MNLKFNKTPDLNDRKLKVYTKFLSLPARSYLEERGLLSSSRNGRSPASVNEDGSVNTSARQERTNAMALSSYRQVQGQAERFSLESMLGVSVYA